VEFPALKRGAHPIIHPVRRDDVSHMTVLELRYASRHRVVRVPGSTGSRFGRDVQGDRVTSTPMTESRMIKMQELRERVERDAYIVDAEKVADAIVARLLAGGSAKDADRR